MLVKKPRLNYRVSKSIFNSNERLIRIVNDLLNISKIELGKMELEKKEVQIEDLIDGVFKEMELRAKKKTLDFIWQKPKGLLPRIRVNELKIRQVIAILIDNAIRYSKEGQVEVKVKKSNSKKRSIFYSTGLWEQKTGESFFILTWMLFLLRLRKEKTLSLEESRLWLGLTPKEERVGEWSQLQITKLENTEFALPCQFQKPISFVPRQSFCQWIATSTKRFPKKIMSIVQEYSQKLEIGGIDEAYLDISTLKSFKKAKKLSLKLKREIYEREKLTCTIGVGPNKMIAKIAAQQAKPDGLLVVKPSQVRRFLEVLDVENLPGIGPRSAEKLKKLG